jgi:heptosyltransferase-2
VSTPPVLVVGPSWVGDMVMAQSLFKVLRERQPSREIDVIAPGWSLPVLARMPEVRRGIEMPLGHGEIGFGTRRDIGRALRGEGYGQAIVLPRSAKSALVPWHARIPVRTGFRGEFRFGLVNDRRPFDRAVLDQTVKRFVALGLERGESLPDIPVPALRIDAGAQRAARARLLPDVGDGPAVGMMPGAEYGPAKCWPLESFASLARHVVAGGASVWLFGGPNDVESGERIAALAGPGVHNLCGRTTLAEVIDLIALCGNVVSNDSGLMHVAAAVGSHVIAIYGSSSPSFTPPLTDRRAIHYLDLDCSPCFRRECPLGHLNCLRNITPEQVAATLLPAA